MDTLMSNGIGSPHAVIRDGKNRPILDKSGVDISEYLVDFMYCYDEEDDDECELIFGLQTNNISFIDNPYFIPGVILKVSWGYLGEKLGPTRIITCRDIHTDYNNDEIKLTLKCTDNASFLKNKRDLQELEEGTFDGYLKALSKGGPEISLEVDDIPVSRYTGGIGYRRDMSKTQEPSRAEVTRVLFEMMAEAFEYDKSTPVVTQVKREIEVLPEGPYFVDGRDNNLTIHNRNFSKPPSKYYVYNKEPGNLISFKPRSNFSTYNAEMQQAYSLDAEDKKLTLLNNFYKVLDGTIQGGKRLGNNNKFGSWELQSLAAYNFFYDKLDEAINQIDTSKNQDIPLDLGNFSIRDDGQERFTADSLGRAKTWPRESTARMAYYQINGNLLLLAALNASKAEHKLKNEQRKILQNQNEADITILGDPTIQSSQVIRVDGVANLHKGRYYVSKAIHRITGMGYKVELETKQVPIPYYIQNNKVKLSISETGRVVTDEKDVSINNVFDSPMSIDEFNKIMDKINTTKAEEDYNKFKTKKSD